MTLIAVCSAKHSPGATTLGLALAARSGALFVEADHAGGDLAARWGLSLNPGLLTLAAASRRGLDSDLIDRHSQTTTAGHRLMVAPPSAEQCRSALLSLGSGFAQIIRCPSSAATASIGNGAVADCGRWDPAGPCVDLVREADVTLLVLRPAVESVAHANARLASLVPLARNVIIVTIGDRPYRPDEVAAALGGATTIAIADDRVGAGHLASGRALDRTVRRTPLVRSLEPLADLLASATSSPNGQHPNLVSA